jgi:hypothetical protein
MLIVCQDRAQASDQDSGSFDHGGQSICGLGRRPWFTPPRSTPYWYRRASTVSQHQYAVAIYAQVAAGTSIWNREDVMARPRLWSNCTFTFARVPVRRASCEECPPLRQSARIRHGDKATECLHFFCHGFMHGSWRWRHHHHHPSGVGNAIVVIALSLLARARSDQPFPPVVVCEPKFLTGLAH